MDKNLQIAVLGATGKVGSHFVKQSLDKGFSLRVLARNKSIFEYKNKSDVSIVVGNSTNLKDVEELITNVDCVVSLLGNVKADYQYTNIMQKSHANILKIAARRNKIPKCIFISSIGCGGSSWIIKAMLSMVAGKKSFNDYEAADKQVREQSIVPSILVRPYALNDKAATGEYKILKPKTIHFAKPLSRADLATCLVSITENNNFLNKTVHVVG
jgi:putative NADH-flavin reductase